MNPVKNLMKNISESGSESADKGLEIRQAKGEMNSSMKLTPNILVVDDEPIIAQQLERLFVQIGYKVESVDSGEDALKRLQKGDVDLIVTDIKLPGLSGVELTKTTRQLHPDVPVIVMTGYAEIGTAVEVLKLGASDYIMKPFTAASIQESVEIVLEKARVFTEIRHLRRDLKDQCEFGGMLSRTPEMHRVFEIIRMVSATDMTVVIDGETGTGKELVASAIHHQSPRRQGPFVTINCAGVPETLLESELFGHERGAFTGADQAKPGKIELAQGGTLFLDEIESIPLSMQAKLLLVLQNQKIQRLGGSRWFQIDMRVIAATNVPLKELVSKGDMRSDFYYRINVIPIHLVPLRQRLEDVPLLVQDFIHQHPVARRKGITGVSKAAINCLMEYQWPGNIRELQNILERAIVLAKGKIIEKIEVSGDTFQAQLDGKDISPTSSLNDWLNEQEKRYLVYKLESLGGRINLTAKSCGIDVKSLYRKMKVHGLDKKMFRKTL